MSRQLEKVREERSGRRDAAIVKAVEYALVGAVAHSGGVLEGFSAKLSGGDCLLVLRVVLAGKKQITFVGAETLGDALLKAVRLGERDKLKYKPDRFAE